MVRVSRSNAPSRVSDLAGAFVGLMVDGDRRALRALYPGLSEA